MFNKWRQTGRGSWRPSDSCLSRCLSPRGPPLAWSSIV